MPVLVGGFIGSSLGLCFMGFLVAGFCRMCGMKSRAELFLVALVVIIGAMFIVAKMTIEDG